jgi:hypothetical protein
MRQFFIILGFAIICIEQSDAQDNPYRKRIGVKTGYPNIIGLDYEYKFNKIARLALNSDIFYFKYKSSSYYLEFFHCNLGPRLYLSKKSKGIFSGVNIGYLSFENNNNNIILNDDRNNIDRPGIFHLDFQSITIQPNIGYRLIKGHFTICPELGFYFQRILTYNQLEFFPVDPDYGADYGYVKVKDESDLSSKFMLGSLTLYLTIGVAF